MRAFLHWAVLVSVTRIQPLIATDQVIKHTNVVIIGATGDLATRYLWKGFFTLYRSVPQNHRFTFYGCGRTPFTKGNPALKEVITKSLSCQSDDIKCEKVKQNFEKLVFYAQTKTSQNFAELASALQQHMQELYGEDWESVETGRLFYLSIPPSVYASTASNIHAHCRPSDRSSTWLRLVIEKPFGHDLRSAEQLASQLQQYFKEEEIYRVDHYLGKAAVKAVLPFRSTNWENYEPLWNRHHIDRVEVVMKETIDVKDRILFFNEVGVIRDVMQNHLTELMLLIAMEIPYNVSDAMAVRQNKLMLLQQIRPPTESSFILGQYDSYIAEANAEFNQKKQEPDISIPTFASVVLTVDNERWRDVPFLLVTGKKLETKSSYIRIVFKRNLFCVISDESVTQNDCNASKREIRFQISPGESGMPEIVITENLPETKPVPWWEEKQAKDAVHQTVYTPDVSVNVDAYSSVISAVYLGQQQIFVDSQSLLAAWKIWSPLIDMTKSVKPRIYRDDRQDAHLLNFVATPNIISFITKLEADIDNDAFLPKPIHEYTSANINSRFLGQSLVTAVRSILMEKLLMDITTQAWEAVKNRGVFHLALSGGKSPFLLFRYMVQSISPFPWKHTHIWIVDERCVEVSSEHSNLKMISDNLLSLVHIPYQNVHPMSMKLQRGLCKEIDRGDRLYEESIINNVEESRLDFVLLGLGEDGHTASLFPHDQSTLLTGKLVTMATAPGTTVSTRRMTMTFNLLNKARSIGLLVTGKSKQKILQTLSSIEDSANNVKYPVTFINPSNGTLTWYIDSDALSG